MPVIINPLSGCTRRKVVPNKGRIISDRVKNPLEKSAFIHKGMKTAHPDPATEAVSALFDHDQARDMNNFQYDSQLEFQETDFRD